MNIVPELWGGFGPPLEWGCRWDDLAERLGHRMPLAHSEACFRGNLIRCEIDAVYAYFVGGPWDRRAHWISRRDAEAGSFLVSTGGLKVATIGEPGHVAGGPEFQVLPADGGALYRFAGTLPTMVPVFSCSGEAAEWNR